MPETPLQPRISLPGESLPEVKRAEHQMTRLLAMSFDGPASPSITLKALARGSEERDTPYGWGLAWYPGQPRCALVIKDPTSIGDNAMTRLLADWERFESTVFVCHLRGAARTLQEQDTHPFCQSHAGRDWVFAHNGDLFADWTQELPLGEDPLYEPVGSTDSEHAFCWLLTELRKMRARRLADVGWERLHGLFMRLDMLGTANLILTDGIDLVAYNDSEGYTSLHWTRLLPPHERLRFEAKDVDIDLEDVGDRSRTMAMVATQPLGDRAWTPFLPGQMIVLRLASLVYDSHADEQARKRIVTPLAHSEPRGRSSHPDAFIESAVQVPGRGAAQGEEETASTREAPVFKPAPVADDERVEPLVLRDRSLIVPGTRLLSVVHDTIYRYQQKVEKSSHHLRLKPVHDPDQEVIAHDLTVNVSGLRRDYEDVFGNQATWAEIETPYTLMRITSRSLVRVSAEPSAYLHALQRRFSIPLVWMPWQRQMMHAYLLPPELPETQLTELYEYALSFVARQDGDLVQTLLDMNLTIYQDFQYVSGSTTLETTPFEVYCKRKGVCQDFANLMICLARLLGVPARYRVGYIYTGASYENKVQSDASHAWAELYLPWIGWQGFDPTNGCLVAKDHVRVACGRNYRDATPTSGTIYKGGGYEQLAVDVRVEEVG
jgi:transglutaminase-like putative cysteine protease/predicted glutamine amidotransferase